MKKIGFILFSIILTNVIFAQQSVGINTTGTIVDTKNFLEVLSINALDNTVGIYGSHVANVAGTGYGIKIIMTGGAATTSNIGADITASGGTNNTGGNFTVSGAGTLNKAAVFTAAGATTNTAVTIAASGGTTATAASFAATGATTNYAIIVPASSGNVGIGTATPTATNLVHVTSASTTASSVGIFATHTGAVAGSTGYAIQASKTGASTTNIAGDFTASGATNNTAGNFTASGAHTLNKAATFTASGATTNTAATFTTSGAHTTNTAASFSATGATSNYAIIIPSSSGSVGIGTSTPNSNALLDITSTTKGILVPRMTNAQRTSLITDPTPDLTTTEAGMLIYQTDVGTTSPTGIGFYYWDGINWTWIGSSASSSSGTSSTLNYANNFQLFEDFQNTGTVSHTGLTTGLGVLGWTADNWNVWISEPPVFSQSTQTITHPGTYEIPLFSAGQNSSIYLPTLIPGNTGNLIMEVSAKVNIASGISTTTTAHNRRIGYANTFAVGDAEPTDGIYFRTTTSGNWFAVTRSGGTETATATGITAPAGTWRKFKIITNSLGTSIGFYIDGTLVATNTTNIPTANLRPGIQIQTQSTYSTSTSGYCFYIDYFFLNISGIIR